MKKILLFILITVITLSTTAINVRASTDTTQLNGVKNLLDDYGAFLTDSDSDGVADAWSTVNADTPTLSEGMQKAFATGAFNLVGYEIENISLTSDHIYYFSYKMSTNAIGFNTFFSATIGGSEVRSELYEEAEGIIYGYYQFNGTQSNDTIGIYVEDLLNENLSSVKYMQLQEVMIIDVTEVFKTGNEPNDEDFNNMLKTTYYSNTLHIDELLDLEVSMRIDHYLFDVPNIFEDFPNNITMENIIRVAFFIPLMIIFYLLIPLFNFVLGGSASGSIMLGLLILAFILREVIRFIDPDFHLFGKNSYQDGYKKPKETK